MSKNHQQIDEIIIRKTSQNYYGPGNEQYTNSFRIFMNPVFELPDYQQIDEFFEKNIEGKKMTAEEAVFAVAMFIGNTFCPGYVEVASRVTDANQTDRTIVKRLGEKIRYD